MVAKKRPCRICRRWFRPHPRAGKRQRVCGAEACQRERHRRACRAWRERERDAERDDRLARTLKAGGPASVEGVIGSKAARDAVPREVLVFVGVVAEVLRAGVRDAVRSEVSRITRESARVPPAGVRDGIDLVVRPP